MTAPRLTAALALTLTILPAGLAGQACQPLAPGVPVRFVHEPPVAATTASGAPARPWRQGRGYDDATFAGLDGDTLRVDIEGAPVAFPASEVTRFRVACTVSTGTHLTRGFKRGAVVGGVAGLVLGLCNPNMDMWSQDDGCAGPTVRSVLEGPAGGALGGALIGGFLGGVVALLSRGPDWHTVPLTVTPAIAPGGEWTVRLRIPSPR